MRRHAPKLNRTRLLRRQLRDWVVAFHERLSRACGRRRAPSPVPRPRRIPDLLTNWQRTRWARAGYPGLVEGHIDPDKVLPYLVLRRRPLVARAAFELAALTGPR